MIQLLDKSLELYYTKEATTLTQTLLYLLLQLYVNTYMSFKPY